MKRTFSILFALVLVLSLSLVTAVPAMAATDRLVPGTYATIQLAIDAANPGDTISVADGTYDEDLTVNTADLTLKSQSGKANTTIQLQGNKKPYIDIQAGADDFTLGGAAGEGFTILSNTGGAVIGFNIQLTNAPSGVTISHNTIDTTGDATMGISIGAAGATGLTITGNNFIAEAGDGSIWGPEVVNIDVSDNTFTGPGGMVSGYAIQFSGVTATSPSIIDGNTITGYGFGILISNGEGTSNLQITNNSVSESKKGISFYEYVQQGHTAGNMTGVTVACNTMKKNTVGLYISAGAHVKADTFVIEYNNFVGNTLYGLQNNNALVVTAEYNWWGDASGPSGVGSGSGDAVTTNVDYEPWSFTPDPCETKTIGFWKTHPDSTEAVLGLGTLALGDDTDVSLSEALVILKSAKAKNAYDMLAAQLLAAILNQLHLDHLGIDSSDFDAPIAAVGSALTGFTTPGSKTKPDKADKATVNGLKDALDTVNNTGCLCAACSP